MISLLLVNKIAQLFVVLFLGFLLVKCKVVKAKDSVLLSKVSLYILMPCVILNAFDVEMTPRIQDGLLLCFVVSVIIHLVLLGIDLLYKKIGKATPVERASVMYSNAANLIIPIVSYILGQEWVIYTAPFFTVQLLFLWTHGIKLFSGEMNPKKILFNTNMIAIAAGLLLMLCGLRLPSFVRAVTNDLSAMIGSVGMLICGMLAATVDIPKTLKNMRLYPVLLLRMVIAPAIMLCLIKLTGVCGWIANGDSILLVIFLATMTPSAAMVMQFAQLHQQDEDFAAAINILSTLMCIITMPIFVALF